MTNQEPVTPEPRWDVNDLRQKPGLARESGRMRARMRLVATAALACQLGFASSPASAESLADLIPELLQTHNLVKAAESDLAAAGERAGAALGGWYPNLNVKSNVGNENINKPGSGTDSSMAMRETDLT